jgi:DNA repair protein RadA/Sms
MATKTSRATKAPGYKCAECGWTTAKWVGRCGECQAWGSVAEAAAPTMRASASPVTAPAVPIGRVSVEESRSHTCGVPELDRVLGGGLVPGAAILLAGEPGVGKSTLLLEVAAQTARVRRRVLYVTGEESASQVRLRADRTNGVHDELYLAAETDLGAILTHIEEVRPTLLVVDSIQTIGASGLEGVPGGVTQVKEVAAALIRVAKTRNITTVLVGHVTKDGAIAGPRVLEHVVDTVLAFEGERHHALRLLRATKHRFGPTNELGLFEMAGHGLVGVPDPSQLFLGDRRTGVAGSAVAPTMEGQRPLLVEVQALTMGAPPGVPARRTTQGIDGNRLALLLAVLQQRAGVPTQVHDVYASAVGGVRLVEPGLDLALCLAVVSAITDRPLPSDLVAFGEVGLGGELRQVAHAPRRLSEAARLGFTRVIAPRSAPDPETKDMRLVRTATLPEALAACGLIP